VDATHIILLAFVVAVAGFVIMARILRKDEAIDAATFLAHRQLDEYVRRSKQASGKSS